MKAYVYAWDFPRTWYLIIHWFYLWMYMGPTQQIILIVKHSANNCNAVTQGLLTDEVIIPV